MSMQSRTYMILMQRSRNVVFCGQNISSCATRIIQKVVCVCVCDYEWVSVMRTRMPTLAITNRRLIFESNWSTQALEAEACNSRRLTSRQADRHAGRPGQAVRQCFMNKPWALTPVSKNNSRQAVRRATKTEASCSLATSQAGRQAGNQSAEPTLCATPLGTCKCLAYFAPMAFVARNGHSCTVAVSVCLRVSLSRCVCGTKSLNYFKR